MGEIGGFLKIDRSNVTYRDPRERKDDYREFLVPQLAPAAAGSGVAGNAPRVRWPRLMPCAAGLLSLAAIWSARRG